jgi:hypothetical protein
MDIGQFKKLVISNDFDFNPSGYLRTVRIAWSRFMIAEYGVPNLKTAFEPFELLEGKVSVIDASLEKLPFGLDPSEDFKRHKPVWHTEIAIRTAKPINDDEFLNIVFALLTTTARGEFV